MNVEEWIASLADAENTKVVGFTSADLRRSGMSTSRAKLVLRQWFEQGKIVLAGYRDEVRIDGRTYKAPVYNTVRRKK